MRTLPAKGVGPTKCVLMRHLAEGEWDVNLGESFKTQLKETVDDGSLTIREHPQESRYNALTDSTVGAVVAAGTSVRQMPLRTATAATEDQATGSVAARKCLGDQISDHISPIECAKLIGSVVLQIIDSLCSRHMFAYLVPLRPWNLSRRRSRMHLTRTLMNQTSAQSLPPCCRAQK